MRSCRYALGDLGTSDVEVVQDGSCEKGASLLLAKSRLNGSIQDRSDFDQLMPACFLPGSKDDKGILPLWVLRAPASL